VAPEFHDKVFGLFEQLDASADGTGIGLATVRRIIEFHGGRIWVDSKGNGHGSTFCFTIGKSPAGESDLAGTGKPEAQSQPA
jgi:signal transduction histidine kinase